MSIVRRPYPYVSAAYAVARWLLSERSSAQESGVARYCYDQWIGHLARIDSAGLPTTPAVVAELGPGASLGVGLCALLTGADRLVALDVTPYASTARNVDVFDELVRLLTDRESSTTPFPSHILSDARLAQVLASERVTEIRARVANGDIEYIVPWDSAGAIRDQSVDLLISTAVLEHVDDVAGTWMAVARWLRPGGVSAQHIDFRSHGRAIDWNGHWAYPSWMWRLLSGRRSPINRQPLSRHLSAIAASKLNLVSVEPRFRADGLQLRDVDKDWRWLTPEDLTCEGAYVIARRP